MNLSVSKDGDVKCQRALRYMEKYPQYAAVFKKIYTELMLEGRSCIHIYQTLIKIRLLLDRCGTPDKLTADCVKEYLAGKSRSYYGAVKKFLRIYAQDIPQLKRIYNIIRPPKTKIQLPKTLTRDEINRLINLAENLKQRTAIAILYETGLRISEFLNIRYEDIEPFEYGYKIHIRKSKSMPRTVLVVEYAHILSAWLNQKTWTRNERVFPFSGDTVRQWLRKLGRKIGIDVHPHLLRHSRATHLYGKLSEKEMMILFGWHKRDMLDIYAHIAESDAHKSYLSLYGIEKKEEKTQQTIECPRCKAINPPNAQYCIRCGYPLNQEIITKLHKQQAEKEQLLRELKELAEEIKELKKRIGA